MSKLKPGNVVAIQSLQNNQGITVKNKLMLSELRTGIVANVKMSRGIVSDLKQVIVFLSKLKQGMTLSIFVRGITYHNHLIIML